MNGRADSENEKFDYDAEYDARCEIGRDLKSRHSNGRHSESNELTESKVDIDEKKEFDDEANQENGHEAKLDDDSMQQTDETENIMTVISQRNDQTDSPESETDAAPSPNIPRIASKRELTANSAYIGEPDDNKWWSDVPDKRSCPKKWNDPDRKNENIDIYKKLRDKTSTFRFQKP